MLAVRHVVAGLARSALEPHAGLALGDLLAGLAAGDAAAVGRGERGAGAQRQRQQGQRPTSHRLGCVQPGLSEVSCLLMRLQLGACKHTGWGGWVVWVEGCSAAAAPATVDPTPSHSWRAHYGTRPRFNGITPTLHSFSAPRPGVGPPDRASVLRACAPASGPHLRWFKELHNKVCDGYN